MKCFYNQDIQVCMVTLPESERARLATLAPDDPNNIRFRPNPIRNGPPIPYWPKGAVREIKGVPCDAVWHCQRGICEPADDECSAALGYSPEQMARAKHVYQRIVDGIQPEDFVAYDSGVMKGYASDGSWIPGPKFAEYEAAQKAAESNKDGI